MDRFFLSPHLNRVFFLTHFPTFGLSGRFRAVLFASLAPFRSDDSFAPILVSVVTNLNGVGHTQQMDLVDNYWCVSRGSLPVLCRISRLSRLPAIITSSSSSSSSTIIDANGASAEFSAEPFTTTTTIMTTILSSRLVAEDIAAVVFFDHNRVDPAARTCVPTLKFWTPFVLVRPYGLCLPSLFSFFSKYFPPPPFPIPASMIQLNKRFILKSRLCAITLNAFSSPCPPST